MRYRYLLTCKFIKCLNPIFIEASTRVSFEDT